MMLVSFTIVYVVGTLEAINLFSSSSSESGSGNEYRGVPNWIKCQDIAHNKTGKIADWKGQVEVTWA